MVLPPGMFGNFSTFLLIQLLAVWGLGCFVGFSLVVVHRLLIAAAPLVAKHRFWGAQASVVAASGSRAQAQ